MTNLMKFYEEVEKNAELKAALVAANKELEGKDMAEAQDKLIEIAQAFGYTLTADDFVEKEGELNPDDLEAVAGGVKFCVFNGYICKCFGEITSKGGCVIIGGQA